MLKMEQLDLQQILKETRDSVRNGHTIEKLEEWKIQLKELDKEEKQSLKYAIQILEEVIKLKKDKNKTPRNIFKQTFLFLFFISLLFGAYASINYKINGETKFSVGENQTLVSNVLRGIDQVLLEESISFRTLITNEEIFSLYRANSNKSFSNVSSDFNGALVHQMSQSTNPYGIEEMWWDKEDQLIHFAINHEPFTSRSNTFRGSLQIVSNNKTLKPNDENFTLCEGNNFVDCIDGDFYTFGDIEAQSIYANENVYAEGSIDSESGIGVPTINAINISTDNLNADLIQAILGKFTNIAVDNINADLLWITDIVVDNLEVTDLNTGGNAGTDLCVDTNDVLCRCGSCA